MNQPLQCVIEDGVLIVRIGVDILSFAAQQRDPFTAYDDKARDWIKKWNIDDAAEFAEDVRRELLREEEDGSSPLTELLDAACAEALNQGSTAVSEAPEQIKENKHDD